MRLAVVALGLLAALLPGGALAQVMTVPAVQAAPAAVPEGTLAASESGETATPTGARVTAIEILSSSPLDEEDDAEIRSLLVVEVGQPLTDFAVRHTLRNLQATGRALETALYTRDEPGGVAVLIALRPVEGVGEVRIAGTLGLSEAELKAVLLQKEDQPLAEEKVVQGVYGLLDLYHQNGYFAATVRVAVTAEPVRQRAIVTYTVASGARATVGEVVFNGPIAPFTREALIEQLKMQPGKPYRRRTAEEDADQLQQWLIGQDHNLARVDRPTETKDAGKGTVNLAFNVEVGPKVTVGVVGADFKSLRKKGLFPFLGREGYDEALVQQAISGLKTYFQKQGFYHVKVDSKEEKGPGTLALTLHVEPGAEFTLHEIHFTGNEGVSERQLQALLQTASRSLINPGSGRLVQAVLDDDLKNVTSYYALQGYAQAKVGPARVEEHGKDLQLTIPVVEGPQLRVVQLDLSGLEKLDVEKLRKTLPLKAGGPFHPILLDQAADTIRTTYAEAGYVQAQVSPQEDWNPDHRLVDLSFKAFAGPRRTVDHVIVRGNRKTESGVIARTLDLQPGMPLSDTRLLEAKRSLYRLGVFSRVEVNLAAPSLVYAGRNVIVEVEEGKARALTYGFGYDTENGFRGQLGFSNNNLFGRVYSLRTDARLSSLDKRLQILLDQPYLFGYSIPITSSLFYFDTTEPTFRTKRRGGRVEATKIVSHRRFSLAYDYRVVELEVDPGVALNDIERKNLPYQIASVVPSVLIDYRDDPFSPTKGWSSLLQLQYSFPAFASDADFLKAFFQQTQYVDLGGPGVLAGSFRIGGIEAFRALPGKDPNLPTDLPSSDVFINERFFAGGRTTNRAYDLDELGVRGKTLILPPGFTNYQPVGGNGLLLLNLDYRFPIFGAFGGIAFIDSGNVWADWRDIRVGDIKTGVGLGARYVSPIGPLRLEVGWKLQREHGESPYAILVSFGNPF